jgi:hypothetical protein
MNRLSILAASAAVAFFASAVSAQAGCYQPSTTAKANVIPNIPKLPGGAADASSSASIVGLWHASHTVNGQLFFESFEQWHSDGTELEFANGAPATGDICLGEWTKTGPLSIKLYHIGWTFDVKGNSTGTFILTATDTLNAKGTAFKGPFTAKFYDVKGKLLQTVSGQTTAERLPAS